MPREADSVYNLIDRAALMGVEVQYIYEGEFVFKVGQLDFDMLISALETVETIHNALGD